MTLVNSSARSIAEDMVVSGASMHWGPWEQSTNRSRSCALSQNNIDRRVCTGMIAKVVVTAEMGPALSLWHTDLSTGKSITCRVRREEMTTKPSLLILYPRLFSNVTRSVEQIADMSSRRSACCDNVKVPGNLTTTTVCATVMADVSSHLRSSRTPNYR